MERKSKILSEQDYDELATELVESRSPKAVLGDFRHPYILTNRKFYPMLLQALERVKLTNKEKESVVSEIIEVVKDRDTYIETDLPDWILKDHSLVEVYLDDYKSINTSDSWEKFQSYILRIEGEIPSNMALSFLHWCSALMAKRYERHKLKCQNPNNCGIGLSYDRRLHWIQTLIQEQEAEVMPAFKIDKAKSLVKIQWLGTQKELAELFIELKKKSWITDFESETIKECFTKSNSIQQVLKPGYDPKSKTKEPTYEGVYTTEYEPKFYGISKNPKPQTD